MKAAVLERYGADGNFILKEVKSPEVKDGQILIQNKASSVNPVDVDIRKGAMRLSSGLFGEHIIGTDFAGIVKETKSSRFQVGDEVFGFKLATAGHTWATEVAVDEDNAVLKPTTLSFAEAASLALVSITAYQAMFEHGKLEEGKQLLINGTTGGVGTAAVQIAKAYGYFVTGTASTNRVEDARKLGCDVVIDYKKEKIPTDKKFDLIFDTAAKLTLTDVEDSLTKEGLLITLRPNTEDLKHAISSGIDLLKSRMKVFWAKSNAEDLTTMKQLMEAGKLKPIIAKTFSISQLSQALKAQEEGGFVGKIAIEI